MTSTILKAIEEASPNFPIKRLMCIYCKKELVKIEEHTSTNKDIIVTYACGGYARLNVDDGYTAIDSCPTTKNVQQTIKGLAELTDCCPCCAAACRITDLPSRHQLLNPDTAYTIIYCFIRYGCSGEIRIINSAGDYEWTKHCPDMWKLLQQERKSTETVKALHCEDCGLAYGCDQWIEATVPNDVWDKIYPNSQGGGILCIGCISRRCRKLGLDKVPVILSGTEALRTANDYEVFQRGYECQAKVRKEEKDKAEARIKELETQLMEVTTKLNQLSISEMPPKPTDPNTQPNPASSAPSNLYINEATQRPRRKEREEVYFDTASR